MERSGLIDVSKGIGIISIVIGHACWVVSIGNVSIPLGPFVYLYHLAIFFFCSGYTYREYDLGEYVVRRIKALYIPFVIYSCVYLIFRPLFVNMGILAGEKFSFNENIIAITNILTYNGVAELLSAFWFLPVLFIAMCIYATISTMLKKVSHGELKDGLRLFVCAFIGYIGLYTTENGFGLLYHMQIAYLMVLIVELGHLYKKYEHKINKFVNVISLALSIIFLAWVLHLDIGIIELLNFNIINKWIFYPVTLVGIWFCLSLSMLLIKEKRIGNIIAYIGKNSFEIMALHLLGFKLIDFIVCQFITSQNNISDFPHTFTNLWLLYIVVGIAFPVGIKQMFILLKTKVWAIKK